MVDTKRELEYFDDISDDDKDKELRRVTYIAMLQIGDIAESLGKIANRIPEVEQWAKIGRGYPSHMKKEEQ